MSEGNNDDDDESLFQVILDSKPLYESYSILIKSLQRKLCRKVAILELADDNDNNDNNYNDDNDIVSKLLKEWDETDLILFTHPTETFGNCLTSGRINLSGAELDEEMKENLMCYKYTAFAVHSSVLSLRLKYFLTRNTWSNNNKKPSRIIVLDDINATGLFHILLYAYSGCIRLSNENFMNIYTSADFFETQAIVQACNEYLKENYLNLENVWETLIEARVKKINSRTSEASE